MRVGLHNTPGCISCKHQASRNFTGLKQQTTLCRFRGQSEINYLLLYSFYWMVDGSLVFQCLNAQSQGVMGLSQVGQSPLLLLQRKRLSNRRHLSA